ncbi:MAG: dTMP kinase [Solirubrobacterales bacterium]|nr:dTMP kinase [Solirubrobacterales bacterium]
MFISFEGVDGSGKSTQARLLSAALKAEGREVLEIREPGGTPAAEQVRELLADPAVPLDPVAELMLFLAARADLVATVLRPALEAGTWVVSDRYSDSTEAYQGHARGLGSQRVRDLNDAATGGLAPDLTVLLDVEPGQALARAVDGGRFETEGEGFQRSVGEAYLEIARRDSDRVVVIDGSGSEEEVHRQVVDAVAARARS